MNVEREERLRELSEEFDVPFAVVLTLADALGEGEDYDGLVTMLEDYSWTVTDYDSVTEDEEEFFKRYG